MKIELESDLYEIIEVKRSTHAKFFKDLSEGDRFWVSMELQNTQGASGGGQYATRMKIYSPTIDQELVCSQNKIEKYLENFEIEECFYGF